MPVVVAFELPVADRQQVTILIALCASFLKSSQVESYGRF